MKNIIQVFESQLKSAKDIKSLTAFLSMLRYLPQYRHIHLQYLYFKGDLYSYFSKLCEKDKRLSELNSDIGGYKYSFPKYDNSISISFFIQKTQVNDLYLICSLTYPYIWKALIKKLIDKLYPRLVMLYWKQKELKNALLFLEDKLKNSYSLVVRELSIKEKREDSWERRHSPKYDSERKWTSKTLKQVFSEAVERGQWFKKVKFQIHTKDDVIRSYPIASCTVTKYGHVYFNNLYQLITSNLLRELEVPLERKISLFKNKGLKERNYIPSVPLSINYEMDVFEDKNNLDGFINIIKRYPHSTKAIFHGNPYFHASIADYKEGSSFDIWVLNLRKILIIPQIKTSVGALERLVSYIFDKFEEGTISEYQASD